MTHAPDPSQPTDVKSSGAGHCVYDIYHDQEYLTLYKGGEGHESAFGQVDSYRMDHGGQSSFYDDYIAHFTVSYGAALGTIYAGGGAVRSITSDRINYPIGVTVCRSGITSGSDCGKVIYNDAKIDGRPHMVCLELKSAQGDSGAPMYVPKPNLKAYAWGLVNIGRQWTYQGQTIDITCGETVLTFYNQHTALPIIGG